MEYPFYRARRLREKDNFRRMVRETSLSVNDFVYPLFVVHGKKIKKEIMSMPGNYHFSVDLLVEEIKEVADLGIPAVLLFGIPKKKDEVGSEAYDDKGIIQQAIRAVKKANIPVEVITDVCLCEYTSHGHCGVISKGIIENDPTNKLLAQIAVSHAEAGADMVAPSDMMDGRVGVIRQELDQADFSHLPIMSYAVKFASAFYGPFRDAALSVPKFGDRRAHQMDPANAVEAYREAQLDIAEGADIIMVKPALPYLDIIQRLRQEFDYPIAAYNVSGEYSMIKAAAAKGWIDEERVMMETLTSIKRAGADIILTYFAREAAKKV